MRRAAPPTHGRCDHDVAQAGGAQKLIEREHRHAAARRRPSDRTSVRAAGRSRWSARSCSQAELERVEAPRRPRSRAPAARDRIDDSAAVRGGNTVDEERNAEHSRRAPARWRRRRSSSRPSGRAPTSSAHSTGALNSERSSTEPMTTRRSAASSTAAMASVNGNSGPVMSRPRRVDQPLRAPFAELRPWCSGSMSTTACDPGRASS